MDCVRLDYTELSHGVSWLADALAHSLSYLSILEEVHWVWWMKDCLSGSRLSNTTPNPQPDLKRPFRAPGRSVASESGPEMERTETDWGYTVS